MSLEQEKMTDPLSLVGTNEEQSPYNLTQEIITNENEPDNNNLDDMLKLSYANRDFVLILIDLQYLKK